MGYDMYQRNRSEDEAGYFYLNIFRMGRYRDLMVKFGMSFHDTPHPEWPAPENYDITREDVWAVDEPEYYSGRLASMTDETRAAVAEYETDVAKVLMWHGMADTPGIPLHKFSSNDGWVVLPAECAAAVKAWQTYCDQHGEGVALSVIKTYGAEEGYWQQWVAYLADSAKRDGFEVC